MDQLQDISDSDIRGRIADAVVNFFALNGKFASSVMMRTHLCGRVVTDEDQFTYEDIRTFTRICTLTYGSNQWRLVLLINHSVGSIKISHHQTFEEAEVIVFQYLREKNYIYVGDISNPD